MFSLNALDAIQEKFGGYDKLGEILDRGSKDLFKNIKWLFALLINESRLADDENAKLLTEEQVGRIITVGNMGVIQNAIYAAFAKGAAGDKEADGDNVDEDEAGEMKAGQDN